LLILRSSYRYFKHNTLKILWENSPKLPNQKKLAQTLAKEEEEEEEVNLK